MRWKNDWKMLCIALLLPLILTLIVMHYMDKVSDDVAIPIGVVMEEQSDTAVNLIENMESVDLLHVHRLSYDDAMQQLAIHELDSVYVIHEGYEEQIEQETYRKLITAHYSNMSFAFPVTTEIVSSYVIQDASQAKAAIKVKELYATYDEVANWNAAEVMLRSEERQQETNLLSSSFQFHGEALTTKKDERFIISPWGIWALFTMVMSFFAFDWVIKENTASIQARWLFTAFSFKTYAIASLILYTGLFFIFDLFAMRLFAMYFNEAISATFILSLFTFRITVHLCAFFIALFHQKQFAYYVVSIFMTILFVICGGAIIPIDGLLRHWTWVGKLSPIHALLTHTVPVEWIVILSVLLIITLWKGRDSLDTSK